MRVDEVVDSLCFSCCNVELLSRPLFVRKLSGLVNTVK